MQSGTGHNSWRVLAYLLAIASFLCMGVLVYRDEPAGNAPAFFALSSTGQKGLLLWRAKNCNTCHQLYGLGGYIGPDLTNVAQRVDEYSFAEIVRCGTGPMPAMDLEDAQIEELYAFLFEMDRSGQGHMPHQAQPEAWQRIFAELARLDRRALRGVVLMKKAGCLLCHQPFRLGRMAAPDLVQSASRYDAASLRDAIKLGRGIMPSYADLRADEVNDILTSLELLDKYHDVLPPPARWSQPVPWFNYRSMPRETRNVSDFDF